jgi:hypothetical protein
MLGGVPGWEEFQVGRSSRLGGVPGWEEFQVGRSSRLGGVPGWVGLIWERRVPGPLAHGMGMDGIQRVFVHGVATGRSAFLAVDKVQEQK